MTSSVRWFLLLSVACALLAGSIFLSGLNGGFLFDDAPNIVHNQAIQITTLDGNALHQVVSGLQPGGITRILPTISFAVDYWRGGGLDPATFKATNIFIHALTTCVLAWFLRSLLLAVHVPTARAQLAASVLALAWAIHPLQVSSVLYSVQRMQTMCTLFLILALFAYLMARQTQIVGGRSRTHWLLAGLFWVLALGSKEDAILLPAYTLALELTILRFRANSPELERKLRLGYLLIAVLGSAAFLFSVIPHYWHWQDYPGRDFSTWERLLTQGRILCMYLGQILLPLPSQMPFYYDWLQPSRGWFLPWTTLPTITVVLALLIAAWRLRIRRPLFAFGAFLFLVGHFITSNVLNLELAFEHRNHFPLLGITLAASDLLAALAKRLDLRPAIQATACAMMLVLLGGTTLSRAHTWGDPFRLAHANTESAPGSARAWNSLCLLHYGASGKKPGPQLDRAIDACAKGGNIGYSVTAMTNLLVFKTIRGDVSPADWDRFIQRLQTVTRTPENRSAIWVVVNNARSGIAMDEERMLAAIEVVSGRDWLRPIEHVALGYFIMSETAQPSKALAHFKLAVEGRSTEARLTRELIADLKAKGKAEWARELEHHAHMTVKAPPRALTTEQ